MRILAYEFITGGGLARETLPPSLAEEGDAMLAALVSDLSEIDGITVVTTRDDRCPALMLPVDVVAPLSGEMPLAHFERAVAMADAVWPIAPESGDTLESLIRIALNNGKIALCCRPEAVRIAASKRRTSDWLIHHGIPAVPTYDRDDAMPNHPGAWVVKPDDGAGCADTFRVRDRAAAEARLAAARGFVAQPWVEGKAMSLSMLCADGEARVLSCNRQQVVERDGILALDRVVVNAAPLSPAMRDLACRVARALPGLWGYVGVDLVDTPRGPVVVEINPRLTTSYCALHAAIGENPAGLVLGLLDRRRCFAHTQPTGATADLAHAFEDSRNAA